ncbi:DoxX family protein [Mycobacterium sp. smrl_JER01]|uniref:DoxX family protein n=1 Tax=Mycobacterium sp. smrl_JER01 TaxID=3402633 RepID=UPI003AC5227C
MTSYDIGLLFLRTVLGFTMAAHGYAKFFSGGGIRGTAGWFESIGMRPGMFHARVAAATEMVAGIALAVGLLTPFAGAGFVALMVVAAWSVHRCNGFFIVKDGWEYNLVLGTAAVAIATLGAGRVSLDYFFFHSTKAAEFLQGWWGLAIAVILGLSGGVGQMAVFYRPGAKT